MSSNSTMVPNVPLNWTQCYDVGTCATYCDWMPCDALTLYLSPPASVAHAVMCQHCSAASRCNLSGTLGVRSVGASSARFARLPGGAFTWQRCDTAMSPVLLAIIGLMLLGMGFAVFVFYRRQFALRGLNAIVPAPLEQDMDVQSEPPASDTVSSV